MNEIFTEKDVSVIAEKVLKSVVGKMTNELSNSFYNEMKDFLHEHYDNASDDIHKKLIDKICDEFAKDPKDYKFYKLRRKIFQDNKEYLVSMLTNEAIRESVDSVVWGHTSCEYSFDWKWKEAFADFVVANFESFEHDRVVSSMLLREISRLNGQVKRLESQIIQLTTVDDE